MTQNQDCLFFIPDISGFTRFVKETELNHSSHIITELLEVLLKQDILGCELKEIEGDALFLYKLGKHPDIEDILRQCEKMFVEFHQHLKVYERDRICHCGACSTAHKLGLKFIVHCGKAVETEIAGKKQLMGIDATIVHRLAKNSIPENEYVLLNNMEEQDLPLQRFGSDKKSGKGEYQDLGEVSFDYYSLEALTKSIPEPEKRDINFTRIDDPIRLEYLIDAPIMDVHQNLIDLSKRALWGPKIGGQLEFPERIGTQHYCILPQGNVKVDVLDGQFSEGRILYIERYNKSGLFGPQLTQIFTLDKVSETSCRLKSETHPILGNLLGPLMKPVIKKLQTRGLEKFKSFCEREWSRSQSAPELIKATT